MTVPFWVWAVTVVALVGVLVVDLFLVDRRPHAYTVREAVGWVMVYVALAVAFAVGLAANAGSAYAGQFLAGYLTEYGLSADNLFVFMVIMSTFRVPRIHQHKVLTVGVATALLMRGAFILVGAAAIDAFEATFFVFGAILFITAWKVLRSGPADEAAEMSDNLLLRAVRGVLPTTPDYHDGAVVVRERGRWLATPLLIVMIAIGTTDLFFALDSIPAVFGLTSEPYLVFAANVFALLGLRQLYFLLAGLMDRLVYLNTGLAALLAFIGVKLVLSTARDMFGWPVPEVGIAMSLAAIVGILAVTVAASLWHTRREARRSLTPEAVPGD